MSVLIREDGTQFILQAYRELLTAKKKSQIAHDVRQLAEQHGQYVHMTRKAHHQYEVVLANEPGYLLGESIWHYFNEPDNLIYCEALADSAQVLLVVIREGMVHLATRVLSAHVQAELLPLMAGDIPFRIVTNGHVPLRDVDSFGAFCFPESLVISFETEDRPVFPLLPVLQAVQMLPLSMALKSERLSFGLTVPTVSVIALLVMSLSWWVFSPNHEDTLSRIQHFRQYSAPHEAMRFALSSPAPSVVLDRLAVAVNQIYVIPGWTSQSLSLTSSGDLSVHFATEGGSVSQLSQWASQHDYAFELHASGPLLRHHFGWPIRVPGTDIAPHPMSVGEMVDDLSLLLQQSSIRLGAPVQRGDAIETPLTLMIKELSPAVLRLLGQTLAHQAVEFHAAKLHPDAGLLSGEIQLSLWRNQNEEG